VLLARSDISAANSLSVPPLTDICVVVILYFYTYEFAVSEIN